VVNHTVELTQEEIDLAKKIAKEQVIAEEVERLKKKPSSKKTEKETIQQQILF
jgi:hypothetical protein